MLQKGNPNKRLIASSSSPRSIIQLFIRVFPRYWRFMANPTSPSQNGIDADAVADLENLPKLLTELNDAEGVASGLESKLDLFMAQIEALEKGLGIQPDDVAGVAALQTSPDGAAKAEVSSNHTSKKYVPICALALRLSLPNDRSWCILPSDSTGH